MTSSPAISRNPRAPNGKKEAELLVAVDPSVKGALFFTFCEVNSENSLISQKLKSKDPTQEQSRVDQDTAQLQ